MKYGVFLFSTTTSATQGQKVLALKGTARL